MLLSSIIFSINGTLKVFDSVVALTNGGPGNATTPLTLYMFQTAFTYGDYGYGSAIALLLTIAVPARHTRHLPLARRDLDARPDTMATTDAHRPATMTEAARRRTRPRRLPNRFARSSPVRL